MSDIAEIDVAVFGGGIAGLWLLNRLRLAGFDALLFEKNSLGSGQTLASQGILHSGVKYAFDQVKGSPNQTLSSMPKIWLECIAGGGEVDLRGTQTLAETQMIFTTGGFTGKIVSAVAGKAFRSSFSALERKDFPAVFQGREFKGDVFRLQEPVLATKTVVTALRDHADKTGQGRATLRGRVKEVRREGDSIKELVFDDEHSTRIRPRACIFTAGEGNEWFAEQLGLDRDKATQRRPVRMFLAHGVPHRLYAHCLIAEPKPRVTITTHDLNGENVWYIGGNIAEKTVGLEVNESLRMVRAEMNALFPAIDWSKVRWAIYDVDRAEPASSKLLPGGPALKIVGNAALAWPAKLVLAPALASQTLTWLEQIKISPSHKTTDVSLPSAEVGQYPWEDPARDWRQL